MDDEDIYATFSLLRKMVDGRVYRDRDNVIVSIKDASHGNTAVHSFSELPSEEEAKKVIELLKEKLKKGAKKVRSFRRIERILDQE